MAESQYKHLAHLAAFESEPMVFFTVVTAGRRPLLACPEAHDVLRGVWERSAPRNGWWVGDYLLMPDHVHALLAVAPERRLDRTVRAWKSYVTQQFGAEWQSGFFDHRIRAGASLDEKAAYIRLNPVRAGLVATPEAWPWVWMPPDAPAVPW